MPLYPENEDAVKIYFIVSRQLIIMAGMEVKVIDINHQAIHSAMELYNVQNKKDCFEKVIKIFHAFQEQEKDNKNGFSEMLG